MIGWVWKKQKKSLHSLARQPFEADDYPSFEAEFEEGNDRSCAIVGAAVLDRVLVDQLDLVFIKLSDLEREKIFFESNSVLGSMSDRIMIAYVLGIITSNERNDLDQIRRIRNTFAHTVHAIAFTNEIISKECSKLATNRPYPNAGPRTAYKLATLGLIRQISARRIEEVNGFMADLKRQAEELSKKMESNWEKSESMNEKLESMNEKLRSEFEAIKSKLQEPDA